MNIRKLASVVTLFCLLVSFGTVSAQNRLEGHTLVEVSCQLSDGREEPTVLPAGTALWIPDPAEISEDGSAWWVGIANPSGGSTSMCWLTVGTFAYGPGSYYYDGYGSDEELPSYEPIGYTFINTEGVACEPNPWYSGEPTTVLPYMMWATELNDGKLDGWQFVQTNASDGLLVECYVEAIYIGEQVISEPDPEVVTEVSASEPAGDTVDASSDTPPVQPGSDYTEATVEDVTLAQAETAAAPIHSPENVVPYAEGGPIVGLPNTGSGDGIWLVRVMRIIDTLITALIP